MRIYLNNQEAQLIKACLNASYICLNQECKEMIHRITDRIELCEQLQKSENRAKKG